MESSMILGALAVSIVGLLMLAYAAESLAPPLCLIGDITGNDLGRSVHVAGNVSGVHRFKGGSAQLSLRDSSGEMDIYLPYDVAAARGDVLNASALDAVGEVEVYRGRLELVVSGPSRLRVLE
jgi:hypothetical protein